ncbi:hypothetical protein [Salisediminibacterium halotolerans]|uniref:Uncharacterized protein n=1 Tax=Salisediminibacterium halotolerans TaxID=517425 RepID=A0A1H9UW87_9BACI|nr:hypothetical protein [Salisediminibacterium haloalkalitolerans]SES13619.1 hypothetical protein SAMN05444126_11628 [Salisediminibacterium haloalkalitolerans]
MIKKMTVSLVFMSVFFLTGLLLYILVAEEENKSSADSVSEVISGGFDNEDYYFYLSDDEIQSKAESVLAGEYSFSSYTLESANAEDSNEKIAFAYTEPPGLTVKREAKKQYNLYGTIPAPEDLRAKLSDEMIPVHIRFYGQGAYIHDIETEQDGESFTGAKRLNLADGAKTSLLIDTAEADFDEPLMIHVTDQANPSDQITYHIDWAEFR